MSSFGDLSKPENLAKLDSYLADNSFLTENVTDVSDKDLQMFAQVSKHSIQVLANHRNIFRWSKAILASSKCGSSGDASSIKKPTTPSPADSHNRPKANKSEQKVKIAHPGKKIEPPAYLADRLKIWDEIKAKHEATMEQNRAQTQPIEVVLPDGKVIPGQSWITTPYDIAKGISNSLAKNCVVAKLDGETMWDMTRPLENSCKIELLKFDHKDAKHVFWHSSAHVIGEAMEQYFGGKLVFGPALDDMFYYDIDSEYTISEGDFSKVEKVVAEITKENQPFERLMVSKKDLLKMFEYNPYKQKVLNEKVTTEYTSAYRCGTLIDLCRGPHLSGTGQIKAFKVLKTSSAYFEGKADQESLSRLYGISFPDKKLLKQWEKFQEEAKLRNHRKIGKDQELFFFDEHSPGCCFWYPKGAFIFHQLQELMREQYRKRGFQEVITPNIFDENLWKTSGHWGHYSENMFKIPDVDKKCFALKPMNCPSHCLMFRSRTRTYRELPLRIADFGVLHRNELAGALTGLTRVRRFQQDDGHIFCTPDHIKSEMTKCLDFMKFIIKDTFGMEYRLFLSTRPESYLGELSVWDDAEQQLKESLTEYGQAFEIDEGGGAFYGPKIDIKVQDALMREHQTATIQLDFQLPIKFNLKYVAKDGSEKQPVIIHRAVLGSLERSMSIVTEHFAGKWPLWMSPRMVKVITVSDKFNDYGREVVDTLYWGLFIRD